MSEPLKPRIDFEQPLQPLDEPVLKAAQAFDQHAAENFYPAARNWTQKMKKVG